MSRVTRTIVVLSCAIVALLALATAAFAQSGPGIMGTPPPAGSTVEEVASLVTNTEAQMFMLHGQLTDSVDLELPLPVFPSSGLQAGPSQCLWTCVLLSLLTLEDTPHDSSLDWNYTLEGQNLHIELQRDYDGVPLMMALTYEISALAIRTLPPAPVESRSFGEIKALFR